MDDYFNERGVNEEKIIDLLCKKEGLGELVLKLLDMDKDMLASEITIRHPILFDDYTPYQPVTKTI